MPEMPGAPQRQGDGWTRREMLRAGGLGLLGLSLLDHCGVQAQATRGEEPGDSFIALLDRYRNLHSRIHAEMAKVVVGQTQLVDEIVMALFCNTHVLLTGVPGVGKGLTLSTLSRVLGLSFSRIQPSNDLLPEDVTGAERIDPNSAAGHGFQPCLGTNIANMVFADCFDCAPPPTQAVLFRAMQERQVEFGQQTLPLERPFLALVMEDPRAGKYPLDDSHKGRFMFNARFSIPTEAELMANCTLYGNGASGFPAPIETVLSRAEIEQIQTLLRRMPVPRPVVDYALRLIRLTRPGQPNSPAFVRDSVRWGSGPRGAQFLILGAKAHALLYGPSRASIEGVRAVAPGLLRHRIELNARARAQGLDGNQIVTRLMSLRA